MKLAISVLGLLAAVVSGAFIGMPHRALAAESAVENMGATVRLLPGRPASPDQWRAGIAFHLEEGWKTYWRVPGDSGVPPVFDWSGSTNLADIKVLWPAPKLFEDGGGHSIGYTSDVILPLVLRPKDPAAPINLHVRMDYAVCSTLCVPAHAELALDLDAKTAAGADGDLVAAHEARVPTPIALGATGSPALTAVTVDKAATTPLLKVTATGPAEAILLVEGPTNWFFAPAKAEPSSSGTLSFTVPIDGAPKNAVLSGTALSLTLATPDGGIESAFTIP